MARAYLVPVATMAKRIVRAKKKIREARIPFRVPGADELPERLPGVLQVIYSICTEGYAASSGPDLQGLDLAEEAIRLARILRRLLPAEREVAGLPALMLLTHARREARTGPDGELVLLDELAGEPRLHDYHPHLVARADLLHRLGRLHESAAAYRAALEVAGSEPERAHLRRRLAVVEES
ncbi:DUF6596 domain-containing protein [Streptosporangium sp. CA-135522]|uniref:DUF6596 domain-containing protein n=1 Tax=Streptosporangium sp. CA-135522 TaxID=3240072 RepID=UPI003D9452DD